jgi:hypothetical protein
MTWLCVNRNVCCPWVDLGVSVDRLAKRLGYKPRSPQTAASRLLRLLLSRPHLDIVGRS